MKEKSFWLPLCSSILYKYDLCCCNNVSTSTCAFVVISLKISPIVEICFCDIPKNNSVLCLCLLCHLYMPLSSPVSLCCHQQIIVLCQLLTCVILLLLWFYCLSLYHCQLNVVTYMFVILLSSTCDICCNFHVYLCCCFEPVLLPVHAVGPLTWLFSVFLENSVGFGFFFTH